MGVVGMRNIQKMVCKYSLRLVIATSIFFSLKLVKPSFGKDFYLHGRIRLSPEISMTEMFNDNIYLSNENEEHDHITSVQPWLEMSLGLFPDVHLDVIYLGLYEVYANSDNFKEDHHYGNLCLKADTEKGSLFELGLWGEDTANQPFSIEDNSREYTIATIYSDVSLNIAAATKIVSNLQYSARRYDDLINKQDDYNRRFITFGIAHTRSLIFPVLLEYRNEVQENNGVQPSSTEFSYQAVFAGFRWENKRRLSGSVRMGYLWSKYDGEKAYDGWATDTDFSYAISASTTATLRAMRGVRESTRSARETLDYFISEGGGISLNWKRFDTVQLTIMGDLECRDYKTGEDSADKREDTTYFAGVTFQWDVKEWLSVTFGYRYRKNESDMDVFEYIENRIYIEAILWSLSENTKRKKVRRN
jgi:hypothetical protein